MSLKFKSDVDPVRIEKGTIKNLEQLLVAVMPLMKIKPAFGSTHDNAFGIELPSERDRFTILGGTINNLKSKGIPTLLMKLSAEFIKDVTSMPSDGIVVVDKERMIREGVDFIELDNAYHQNHSSESYMRQGYQKILERKGIIASRER